MKLSMFRTVPLPIIRSVFIVRSAMVYVIQVCRQLSSRTRMERIHPGPDTIYLYHYSMQVFLRVLILYKSWLLVRELFTPM
jgi:hypothetical protein